MSRLLILLALFPLILAAPDSLAQAKKGGGAMRIPTAKDPSVSVIAYMRDAGKNEVLIGTRVWPDNPEYNAVALQRFFAMMKSLEPGYRKDDDVAYTWQQKARVTKCSIYLESDDAGIKSGTGAAVGCEANGVSTLRRPVGRRSEAPSGVAGPKHLADVMELFRKQLERAKSTVTK